MVSVVLSHVIGTVSLLLIFVSVVTYASLTYSILGSQVVDYNLQKISEHVVSETINMVSLCSISSDDEILVKVLEVPKDIGGNQYTISMANSGDGLAITSNQISSNNILGVAPLPWSHGRSVVPFNGTDPGINKARVIPKLSVGSSAKGLVLWCVKKSGVLTFGLGVKNATQGG